MSRKLLVRSLILGVFAVLVTALATPAAAQTSSMRGRVVDEAGKPVAGVEVTITYIGDYDRQYSVKTNDKGEFARTALDPGRYNVLVKKEGLTGKANGIIVSLGEVARLNDIVLQKLTPGATQTDLSAEEAAKRNKRQAELEKMFNDASAQADAGQYDEALAVFNQIVTENTHCAGCYAKIGDTYQKKGDLDNAEKSYLKAIDLDPNLADAYMALATLYNQQKKFDEAAKMAAKGNELKGATGGGDANSVFNQGIILWNQSKIAEAKVQFQKAVDLDPKLAEAHYWLAMSMVNEGKLQDSKKEFEAYLALAPTGQYAETAKSILATIKM